MGNHGEIFTDPELAFLRNLIYTDNRNQRFSSLDQKKGVPMKPHAGFRNESPSGSLEELWKQESRSMGKPAQNEDYRIADIFSLPDGERAELLDGKIYYMAPPNTKHQRLLNYISTEINLYIRGKNGDCEVFPAPFAVFLNGDDRNYMEPDLSVICDRNKITEKGCLGAPDWIIEIVSPGSRQMDYYKKLIKYRTAGVRVYWVVDPDMDEYSFGLEVPVGIYNGFSIKVQ